MKNLIFAVWLCTLTVGFSEHRELYTRTYVVPPNFLTEAAPESFEGKPTAKTILEANGITFGEGSSAIYNAQTSQIIMRNTLEQQALLEQLMDAIREQNSFQVHVRLYEASFEGNPFAGVEKDGHDLSGLFSLDIPKQAAATPLEDRASLMEEMRRVPKSVSSVNPGIRSKITGVLTEPQLDSILPILKETDGVVFRELPSVMIRSGKPGLVQVDDQRYGVIPTVGSDRFTIELEAFLPPHGRPLLGPGDEEQSSFHVTVWDDQTVVYYEEDQNGPDRLVFIHGVLVDPAGFPLHAKRETPPNPEPAAPERQASSPGTDDIPLPAKSPKHPDLRQDEIDRIYAADQAAFEGIRSMERENFEKAIEALARAKILLPDHPMTEKRREAYSKQLERARDLQVEQARRPIESHLVKEGETLYQIARKYGLSVARLKEANRFESDTVKIGQVLLIPEKRLQGNLFPKSTLEETLGQIVIREINLQDASLEQALAKFRQDIIDHENPMLPEIDAQLVLQEAETIRDIKITLRLSNVPAAEALRYITDLAQCSYQVSDEEIVVSPAK